MIETFDVVSPLEPIKPARPYEGTVDVRHERNRTDFNKKAAKKKAARKTEYSFNHRYDYERTYGKERLAELDDLLRNIKPGQLVYNHERTFGVVISVNVSPKAKAGGFSIDVLFSKDERAQRYSLPISFYNETLTFVPDDPAIRDLYDLHHFEPKEKGPVISTDAGENALPFQRPEPDQSFGVGSLVEHEVYGIGSVIVFKPPKMNVHFRRRLETKTFPYPESIQRGVLSVVECDESGELKSASKKKPSKGPKLRVKNGKLVCPNCEFVAKPGSNVFWCPRCAEKG